MIKIIGVCLILLATSMTGFQFARALRLRAQQLRQWQSALTILESEIMYGQTPLREATQRISTQIPMPVARFFMLLSDNLERQTDGMSTIYENALQHYMETVTLSAAEFEIIRQFGATLGKHDRFAQQQQIQITITHLARIEKEAVLRQQSYEKMTQYLGVLSGLLIVMLLL